MATGRFISDLAAGDVLGSVEYVVTPFIVREHCHSAELHQEVFHGGRDGVQTWPPLLVFSDKLKLFGLACPGGEGPVARVLSECRFEWMAAIGVGDRLLIEGHVTDRFERRGREYIDIEVLVSGADDRRVRMRYSDTAAFLGPVIKPAGASAESKSAPRPADPSPTGEAVRAESRRMTVERIRWFCDAQETTVANDGRLHVAAPNIHNDDAFAKSQGLPGIIGFGMTTANWIYGLLLDRFGNSYLERGALITKFLRPVFVDQLVTMGYREKQKRPAADGMTALDLDIWCEDDAGKMLMTGSAIVYRNGR